jgi:hypothetical protein
LFGHPFIKIYIGGVDEPPPGHLEVIGQPTLETSFF